MMVICLQYYNGYMFAILRWLYVFTLTIRGLTSVFTTYLIRKKSCISTQSFSINYKIKFRNFNISFRAAILIKVVITYALSVNIVVVLSMFLKASCRNCSSVYYGMCLTISSSKSTHTSNTAKRRYVDTVNHRPNEDNQSTGYRNSLF